MSRKLRIEYPEAIYQVMNRGDVFQDDHGLFTRKWLIRIFFFVSLLLSVQQAYCVTNLSLEVVSVTNGVVNVVLHNVRQGGTYELLSKVALADPQWKTELVVHAIGNQDWIAATVPVSNRTNGLYLRALDVGSFASSYITDGLVQWNKLDDGAGTVAADASGNGNTFPLVGSPSWGANFLTLDGATQYGDAGSNQLAVLEQHDLTICVWIKKMGSSFKALVDKAYVVPGNGYGGWGFRVLPDNHLEWWVQDGQQFVDNGPAMVATGDWTFVTVTWHYPPDHSGNQAAFYINGVLNSIVGNGAAVEGASANAHLELGNMNNNAANGAYVFDGSMHDVGIYNRVLSAAEIGANYLGSEFVTNVDAPDLLYYKMTEYAQTVPPAFLADSSTHGGTTGTVFNANANVLQWVPNAGGYPGAALHFDGSSTYIDTGNSALFNFTTNPFSLNLWVRPVAPNSFLMENGIPQTTGWYLSVGNFYQIQFGMETNGADYTIQTGTGATGAGQFTMVTIVRTGPTNALIYINGIQVTTTGSITIPAASTNSLVLGEDSGGGRHLNGDLWLPQIWSEALSPTAIANLYLRQSSGRPWPAGSTSVFDSRLVANGLVQWNKLNEGSGATATDASGNRNTFPLVGSPAWGTNYLILDGSTQYGDAGSNQLSSLDVHDMTICAWIKKTGSSFKPLVDKSFVNPSTGYGGWGFRVLPDNHLDWWVQDGQDFVDNGAATVNTGEWTFVAVTWQVAVDHTANLASFYVNGILNSIVGNGAAVEAPSATAHLQLGNGAGGTNTFDGSMHDVGIYSRVLSPGEIAANYLASGFNTNVGVPDLLYYKMTESRFTNPPVFLADSSTHGGTTGTVHSGYVLGWVTNVAQIPDTALHFNGVSTFIDTSNSVLFNFTTNLFTINLWTRPLTANGYLMENGIPQTNGWYLKVGGSYQIQFGTEANGTDNSITTAPGATNPGKFSMVTIVRSGPTNLSIYINGIQASTTGAIVDPASSTNSLIIGTDRAGGGFLDGDVWLPQIWGEALSATEIAYLYLIQSSGRPWP